MLTMNGLIYIAGGHDIPFEERNRGAIYNVEEEKWEYIPLMIWSAIDCHCVFVDNKLYVVERDKYNSTGVQCYDPDTRLWTHITQFSFSVICSPLPAFGRLFYICKGGVIEFDHVENRFHIAGTQYPHLFTVQGMTMWHSQIVICGKGEMDGYSKLYLFEPFRFAENGQAGNEEKWTLLKRWSSAELGDLLKCCGTLTL
ncbi:hypothetical protein SUGI_0231400 [Cryptomeria japonica]|nr:hypothetical protein SUGI_0231400 [Cryptomeria japonica]